ncbi:transcription factor TGA2.3-like isoform X3 [Musa acuminata AAA Group]
MLVEAPKSVIERYMKCPGSFRMVREGEEEAWMATHRIGETGLSDSGPSTRSVSYGVHGTSLAASNFFDQEGAAYFGELEEALMQGVDGIREIEDRKSFFGPRPATLEIFPSWPMRFQQTPRGKAHSARSTDSGSAQNTPSHPGSDSTSSRKETLMMMMTSGASMTGTTPTLQPTSQDKPQTTAKYGRFTEKPTYNSRIMPKRIPIRAASLSLFTVINSRKMTDSTIEKHGKQLDAKTLRRLAQNREAARKSRLKKKAYVQQLESSRLRLKQLEQELQRARSQGLFLGVAGSSNEAISPGAAMFDMEHARWLDENCKLMSELRGALQAHLPEASFTVIVDQCIMNYDELFQLKAEVAKSDVFHLLSGSWTTPAERSFLWMGGFRPSELLQILIPQLDPSTEQQLIYNLKQSSQQAEEALSQGLEQLHQSLADTVAGGPLSDGVYVGNYMGHMVLALEKLAHLEGFVRQADNLRQETLHQLRRILTSRQAARCFVAIGEYYTRLRALSSLWASRPRQNLIGDDSVGSSTTDLQIVHPSMQDHFSGF